MEDTIKEILGDILGLEQSAIEDSASSKTLPGWDSIKHVEIVSAVEQEFDILLSIEDIENMGSFREIVSAVRSHKA